MGAYRPTSNAMKAGIEAEAERQRLEDRRSFAQYGIVGHRKRFQVPVVSATLGLAGRIDCLLELTEVSLEDACEGVRPRNWQEGDPLFVPVEYKSTFRRDQRGNSLQLAAYARLIEEMTHSPVDRGFIVMLPEEEVVEVPLGRGLRQSFDLVLDEVRAGLDGSELPPATPHRGRCQACEFRRFCNDVW